ncbi:nucleotidyltransferase family protein [Sphingomonas sp. S2-65]|uniref:nucleotidyltransferase family protein n=1 Tax=Sphingomonas sp. S2-65 TaxID=2903960 RepID=UPI001F227285|nr:nucleotidyltransferase family protein [Sphingomonas sp. S2-65]UYY57832.1 nucleotidyltransferase family protein [Sphingomonas sp. S2-65]
MLTPERTALLLLAAGRSQRFGTLDKLAMPYLGKPLALHAVTALMDLPFLMRVAVVAGTKVDFTAFGYKAVHNSAPDLGQSQSLSHGVAVARNAGADAVLVVLADMPLVSAGHVRRLFATAAGTDAIVASSDGTKSSPPALFGQGWFEVLMDLKGDQGARDLVRRGRQVVTSSTELVDVDTPEDLERLNELYGLGTDRM